MPQCHKEHKSMLVPSKQSNQRLLIGFHETKARDQHYPPCPSIEYLILHLNLDTASQGPISIPPALESTIESPKHFTAPCPIT